MNNDRITEVYDGVAGSPRQQRLARQRIHWMCSQQEGNRILDLGCSQGIASILLGREGHDVVGVDNELSAIRFARERLQKEERATRERVEFLHAEGGDLPLEDKSFDGVLLGEVI